jgi:predicted ABC-type ATPase
LFGQVNFGFETTLAGRGHVALLQGIRSRGYAIQLYFLWLPSANLAVERVAYRVKRGGHNVEEPVVRRRYEAGIQNLWRHYRPLLDQWILFDNSGAEPKVIARETNGKLQIADNDLFTAITKKL